MACIIKDGNSIKEELLTVIAATKEKEMDCRSNANENYKRH